MNSNQFLDNERQAYAFQFSAKDDLTDSQNLFDQKYISPLQEQSFAEYKLAKGQKPGDLVFSEGTENAQNIEENQKIITPSSGGLQLMSSLSSIQDESNKVMITRKIPNNNLLPKKITNYQENNLNSEIIIKPEILFFDLTTILRGEPRQFMQELEITNKSESQIDLSVNIKNNQELKQSNPEAWTIGLIDLHANPASIRKLQSQDSAKVFVNLILRQKNDEIIKQLGENQKIVLPKSLLIRNGNSEYEVKVIIKLQNSDKFVNQENDQNNASIMSNQRYSLQNSNIHQITSGQNVMTSSAIDKMRSLSKELRESKINRGSSFQRHQFQFDGSLMSHGGHDANEQSLSQFQSQPLSSSQLRQGIHSNPDKLQQQNMKSYIGDLQKEIDQNKDLIILNNMSQTFEEAARQASNMTASFNAEELKILEQQYRQIMTTNQADKSPNKSRDGSQKHKFRLTSEEPTDHSQFEKLPDMVSADRQTYNRNYLTESQLLDEEDYDESYSDIARKGITPVRFKNQNKGTEKKGRSFYQDEGALNMTDITGGKEGNDPNGESLKLNQLQQNSKPFVLSEEDGYSYSKSLGALGQQKNDGQQSILEQTGQMEQTDQIYQLREELRTNHKIIQNQKIQLEEEVKYREKLEIEIKTKKLQGDTQILDEISKLLREEEPNLEEIMALSLKQERQRQQSKDNQVLQLLKQKDRQIQNLTQTLDTATDRLGQQEQQIEKLELLNQQLSNQTQQLIKEMNIHINNFSLSQQKILQLENIISKQTNHQECDRCEDLGQRVAKLQLELEQQHRNFDDDLKIEENRLLVQELDRVEQQFQEVVKQNQELKKTHSGQIENLQQKLSQSFHDIQRLTSRNELNEKNPSSSQTVTFPQTINQTARQSEHEPDKSQTMKSRSTTSAPMDQQYFSNNRAATVSQMGLTQQSTNSIFVQQQDLQNRNNYFTQQEARQSSDFFGQQELLIDNPNSNYELQQNERQNPISIIEGQIPEKKYIKGMSLQDLHKFCDMLIIHNQKLQAKVLEVHDVYAINQKNDSQGKRIPSKNPYEVFNPYKTDNGMGDKEQDSNKNKAAIYQEYNNSVQFDPIESYHLLEENFSLKQQIITLSSPKLFSIQKDGEFQIDDNHMVKVLQQQLSQSEQIIKQLKEQILNTEQQYRDEINSSYEKNRETQDKLLRMFKEAQGQQNQSFFETPIETQNFEKEVKLSLSKLQILYSKIVEQQEIEDTDTLQPKKYQEFNKIEKSLHSSLLKQSEMIFQYKKEIYGLRMRVISQDANSRATVINRILATRHVFLVQVIQTLLERTSSIQKGIIEDKKHLVQSCEHTFSQFEKDLVELKVNEKEIQYEKLELRLRSEISQLEQNLKQKDKEINNMKDYCAKKAEVEYDSRQKLRDEKIKNYLDKQVMTYLLKAKGPTRDDSESDDQPFQFNQFKKHSDKSGDPLEITRKFCDLQVELEKVKQQLAVSQLESEQANKKLIDMQKQVDYFKEQSQLAEERRFETNLNMKGQQRVQTQTEFGLMKQLRQEISYLHKQLTIRSSELNQVKVGQLTEQFKSCFWKFEEALGDIEKDLQMGRNNNGLDQFVGDQGIQQLIEGGIGGAGYIFAHELRAQVEALQKQIIDLRTQHLLEIEEIKINCEVELVEERSAIKKHYNNLSRQPNKFGSLESDRKKQEIKFSDYNQLKKQNDDLLGKLENLKTEIALAERRIEKERLHQLDLKDEIKIYKESLEDLKREICEPMMKKRSEVEQIDDVREQSPNNERDNFLRVARPNEKSVVLNPLKTVKPQDKNEKSGVKGGKTRQQKQQKITQLERQSSFSSFDQTSNINIADSYTHGNSMNTYRSNQFPEGMPIQKNDNQFFVFTPPLVIDALFTAKIRENQILKKLERSHEREQQARNELRKALSHHEQSYQNNNRFDEGVDEREIQNLKNSLREEKVKSHDLENQIRDLELKFIKKKVDFNEDDTLSFQYSPYQFGKVEQTNYSQNDYVLMVRSLIYLIDDQAQQVANNQLEHKDKTYNQKSIQSNQVMNIHNERRSQLTEQDLKRVSDLDQVYKIIIMQLTRKIRLIKGLSSPYEDEDTAVYIPRDQRNQKLWYLELLESQIQAAEGMTNKLLEFVRRLQVEIQGSLTSAAQIKATSLDLAQNTRDASEEVLLLKNIARMIRSDIYQTFPELGQKQQEMLEGQQKEKQNQVMVGSQSLIDVTNQLTITQQLKLQAEQELAQIKEQAFKEKIQYKDELSNAVTKNNKLEEQLLKIEKKIPQMQNELNKFKEENHDLSKQLKKQNKNDGDQKKSKDEMPTAVQKNFDLTSKNLVRLQKDMTDWRKTTDENLKLKDQIIGELKQKQEGFLNEAQKLKVENQMLRKNQKQWLGSTTKQIEEQKQAVQSKLEFFQEEAASLNLKWKNEKHQLETKIQELEEELADRKGEGLLAQEYLQPEKEAQSDQKLELKLRRKLEQKVEKLKQIQTKVENLQDENNKLEQLLQKQEQNVNNLEQELKEQEKNYNQLQQDHRKIKIQKEIYEQRPIEKYQKLEIDYDILCSQLSEFKVENEVQKSELQRAKSTENQWRQMVDSLKTDIERLNNKIQFENGERQMTLQIKEEHLSSQLKNMELICSGLKKDNFKLLEQLTASENNFTQAELQTKSYKQKFFDLEQKVKHLGNRGKEAEDLIYRMRDELTSHEIARDQYLQDITSKLEEVKQTRVMLEALYSNQIDQLKEKLAFFINKSHDLKKDNEKGFRDADYVFQITQKEALIVQLKKEIQAFKVKKEKPKQVQEEQTQKGGQERGRSRPNSKGATRSNSQSTIVSFSQDNSKIYPESKQKQENILQKLQNYNKLQEKLVEQQAYTLKLEGLCQNLKIEANITSSQQPDLSLILQNEEALNTERDAQQRIIEQLKRQIKKQEAKIKEKEQEIHQMADLLKEFESQQSQLSKRDDGQIRQLKEEEKRRKELVNQLKEQRDKLDQQLKDALNQIQILKDDNSKLKLTIKRKPDEKQIIDVVKIKPQDNNLKDELEQMQTKIRDVKNRHKLEIEVKDNQIKALKQKSQQLQEQVSSEPVIVQPNQDEIRNAKKTIKRLQLLLSQLLQILQDINIQMRQKVKFAIKELKEYLNNQKQSKDNTPKSKVGDVTKELYKDSVDILGISVDELVNQFVNPDQDKACNISTLFVDIEPVLAQYENLCQNLQDQLRNK